MWRFLPLPFAEAEPNTAEDDAADDDAVDTDAYTVYSTSSPQHHDHDQPSHVDPLYETYEQHDASARGASAAAPSSHANDDDFDDEQLLRATRRFDVLTRAERFHCPHCNVKYTKLKYLKTHMKLWCGQTFRCALCHIVYKQKRTFVLHMKQKHGNFDPQKPVDVVVVVEPNESAMENGEQCAANWTVEYLEA